MHDTQYWFTLQTQKQAVAVSNDNLAIAVIRQEGQQVSCITHYDASSKPALEEISEGKRFDGVGRAFGPRIVAPHRDLMTSPGQPFRQIVSYGFDPTSFSAGNRQTIADNAYAHIYAGWAIAGLRRPLATSTRALVVKPAESDVSAGGFTDIQPMSKNKIRD